jgi:hypothetical protein
VLAEPAQTRTRSKLALKIDQLNLGEEPTTHEVPDYNLLSQFCLRMTGFPIETIQAITSAELAAVADRLIEAEQEAAALTRDLLERTRSISRSLRRRMKRHGSLSDDQQKEALREGLAEYSSAWEQTERLQAEASALYEDSLAESRKKLYQFVTSERFQQVLLLSSSELLEVTPKTAVPPANRSNHVRQRELSWTLYLQRLTTKNETVSFFGPTEWGEIDAEEERAAVIELADTVIAERMVYMEGWLCESLAALISADSDAQPLLPLRLADNVLLGENEALILTDGRTISLPAAQIELLRECETTQRRSRPETRADEEELIHLKLLTRQMRVALSPSPFDVLYREVSSWPEHSARTRWKRALEELEKWRIAVECAVDLPGRRSALRGLETVIQELGAGQRHSSQKLYASRLPFNEDCLRAARDVRLGRPVVEQATKDLAPWYELWRDLVGLYAIRMHQAIRPIWEGFGQRLVPVPAFVRSCGQAGFPLGISGGTNLWPDVEQEIQDAWQQQLGDRASQPEIQLTEEDAAFVRRNFELIRLRGFDNMAPDLQIIARDKASLAEGRWQLLLAEIHPDFSCWQNCLFMWCPDATRYAQEYSRSRQGMAAVIGRYPPYFASTHQALWIYPYAHDWNFIGVAGPEGTRPIRSAEAVVEMTEDDILVRHVDGRLLGSLLHTWNLALNVHRLELRGNHDHSPRLLMGRAIVQRESWNLRPEPELLDDIKAGGFAAFSALRRFRRMHGLPENVFVRGCISERLSFHKDVKPVFMDFRSPLLAEVLAKMVARFRRLSITEMLPGLEDCWLTDSAGHYSCEFRTVVTSSNGSAPAGRPAQPA